MVRNFYATVTTDGRAHPVTAGPGGAGGGMVVRIQQRAQGDIAPEPLEVECRVGADGALCTVVHHGGRLVYEVRTTR